MKILMYRGHGQGTNIQPWLDWFQHFSDKHRLTYLAFNFSFDRSKYDNIDIRIFFRSILGFLKIIQFLRKHHFDVVYIHGLYEWKVHLLLLIFSRTKLKLLNIWNNVNYLKARRNWSFLFYRFILQKVDRINFNWYNTHHNFIETYPYLKQKCMVCPWGLQSTFFDSEKPKSDLVSAFLNQIPDDVTVAFCPKSINKYNRHDLVISAISMLKHSDENLLQKFKFYIWTGNFVSEKIMKALKKQIKACALTDTVIIVKYPHVSFSDMVHIWKRTDLAINIVDVDQLSVSVLEPLYMKKDIVLSDIDAYRFLNEKLSLNLTLTKNDPTDIAQAIKQIMTQTVSDEERTRRRQIISNHFNFDQNIKRLMQSIQKVL